MPIWGLSSFARCVYFALTSDGNVVCEAWKWKKPRVTRAYSPAREPHLLAFLLIEIQLRLTTTGKTVKSSIPQDFKLVPVRSGFAYLLCEPFSSNRSQFESTLGSAEVMIFDNLVVDNKRWHLSNSMLFGRSDSLRGQIERTAINELLDYTTLKSVELLGLPI